MNKKAEEGKSFMNINMPTVARYGLGGLGLGAGTAATLSLIHMLKNLNDKRNKDEETDDNTIVLTLPKRASDLSEAGIGSQTVTAKTKGNDPRQIGVKDTSTMTTEGSKVKSDKSVTKSMESTKGQLRQPSGEYGMKIQKRAAWPTLTASLLAGGIGSVAGYKLVDKIYEVRRMKKKQLELDSAKEEYLDMLQKASSDFEKSAGDFNIWDYPAGIGALALLLGSGGTAYVTKKVLDEHTRTPDAAGPAKVKRIVFRSAPSQGMNDKVDTEEEASTEEAFGEDRGLKAASVQEGEDNKETFKAALGVMLDVCGSKYDILKTAAVQEGMEEAGVTAGQLYKMAGDDYNNLMATLQANPKLRNLITRATMDKHPLLKYFKWTSGLPGISGYADKKIYEGVTDQFGPKVAAWKEAGLLDMLGSISASTIGSSIADKKETERKTKEVAAPAVPEQEVEVEAADPAAAAFVLKNQTKIREAIAQLQAQGKL